MEVRAIFELPVHIWLMCDALGATYPTGYRKLRFNVAMPTDRPPVGGPPAVPGVDSRAESVGEQVVWVREHGASSRVARPATALHRVCRHRCRGPKLRSHAVVHPGSSARRIHRQVVRRRPHLDRVVTGQDLDPNHRVYDAESVGEGLTSSSRPTTALWVSRSLHPASFPFARRSGLTSSGLFVTARSRRWKR